MPVSGHRRHVREGRHEFHRDRHRHRTSKPLASNEGTLGKGYISRSANDVESKGPIRLVVTYLRPERRFVISDQQ